MIGRAPKKPPSARFRAQIAWGDDAPAWVMVLAAACDDASQNIVAKQLGYSAARISQILNRRNMAGSGVVERAVRGAFMGDTVACPALHQELPSNECVTWQRRPYDGSNHQTVRMFLACRYCPNRKQEDPA